jgi:hypothetical protein
MTWRVARSLLVLRDQINAAWPDRSRVSDGTIGDAAHATRDSDHNPWLVIGGTGVVTAMDITHDPAHGVDIDRITDELAASRDPRIKYVIANGFILDSRPGHNPWRWMPYGGSNPHTKHFHLSVLPEACDDPRPWALPSLRGTTLEDDMTPEQDAILRDIREQLCGQGGRAPGQYPGWPSRVNPANRMTAVDAVLYTDRATYETRALVTQLQAGMAGLTQAVAALSQDPDLTRDEVAEIVLSAVRQSIEITGTVQITPKETA